MVFMSQTEREKLLKDIENYINFALERYSIEFLNNENLEDMHSRLDELLLLWSNINKISFIESCKYFEISYKEFDEHNHQFFRKPLNNFEY